jgi:EmrB/QacA subfamily drug resistance transporter
MTAQRNPQNAVGSAPTTADGQPTGKLDARSKHLAFGAIMLVAVLSALDQSIVSTALPRIVQDLGGFNDLSWVVSAYLLASTVTIPLYGKLSDLYGRRLLLVVAISVFLLGSALCGFATSMGQLIAFRGLQGLGAGGLVPLAQAAIGDLYAPRERGRYQGYVASMWGIPAVAGPLVGGTLTQAISWRWIFYVNLPLGLVALAVIVKTLAGTGSRAHQIDYAGAMVFGVSLGAILTACTWSGTTYPMTSAEVIGPFVAGVLGLVAFALIERHASEPIVPLGMFRSRNLMASVGAFFVMGAVIFSITIYIPVYLQDVRGNTPIICGATMISFSVPWAAAAILGGQLMTHSGRYRVFPIVGASLTTAGIAALVLLGDSSARTVICVLLAVVGSGLGLTASPYLVGAQNVISRSEYGSAAAAMNLFRAIGGSLSVSVLGALLASRAQKVLTEQLGRRASNVNVAALINGSVHGTIHDQRVIEGALLSGLHAVYAVAAIVALVGVAFAIVLKEYPLTNEVAGG